MSAVTISREIILTEAIWDILRRNTNIAHALAVSESGTFFILDQSL